MRTLNVIFHKSTAIVFTEANDLLSREIKIVLIDECDKVNAAL